MDGNLMIGVVFVNRSYVVMEKGINREGGMLISIQCVLVRSVESKM